MRGNKKNELVLLLDRVASVSCGVLMGVAASAGTSRRVDRCQAVGVSLVTETLSHEIMKCAPTGILRGRGLPHLRHMKGDRLIFQPAQEGFHRMVGRQVVQEELSLM